MTRLTANITVTATHVVCSQNQISIQDPFVLGPFDQLGHFATPINAVWIYEPLPSVDLIPLERLHKAISHLLDYYPHLTGRIHINPDTDVRSITRLGTGIHLLEAYCDTPLQSFTHRSPESDRALSIFDLPGGGNALLAPWDMSPEGAQRDPVFTIQPTVFACSAVAIGVRVSHVVCAAGGFLGLDQDLAEIYRATDPVIGRPIKLTSPPYLPPFMVNQMLHMTVDEQRKALSVWPAGYSLRDHNAAAETHAESEAQFQQSLNNDPIVGRSLRFSPSALATLKSHAVDPDSGSARVSAFTALSAHFWQRTHLARLAQAHSCSSEKTSVFSSSAFGTSVNFVPHLGLPQRSFGNTLVTPVIELQSMKLAQAPLWEIAKIIAISIRHISVDETQKLGSWIAAQPKKAHIKLDFPCTPASFIATGWHRFPLYSGAELDVTPTFASPVPMDSLFDGMVVFVEPKAKDDSIEAVASMRASTWEFLDRDEEFINTWDATG
ncbi:hypothetical protein ASPVEDRAFT_43655 [Aspergillus versicolor CBS 583.65]|uniref:Transferase family protein n=1 Tax=Aspergillus versicolor CBS 583.65 TaxID=1036611 RepID=A0A1L9PRR8_ASPVE|nr:uncharacterized protein ASPVEDRAFT_43655 [Aspergillus versicolor CBS 583.65]OJJ04193.1 hypothetical protein ASPVEDRAFT_43655 [Aspergillus versicolor CBS 583.65]